MSGGHRYPEILSDQQFLEFLSGGMHLCCDLLYFHVVVGITCGRKKDDHSANRTNTEKIYKEIIFVFGGSDQRVFGEK